LIEDEIERAALPSQIYRIGKKPDAWKRPLPTRGENRPTNRYDDPLGIYHVVYAASDAYGACVEKFAALRHDLNPDLASIDNNDGGLRSSSFAGLVPINWFQGFHLGSARLQGNFVDLRSPKTIAFLSRRMTEQFREWTRRYREWEEFDLSVLASPRREVTMEISRSIFELETREGSRYDGICYPSRLGTHVTCWAIFDDTGEDEEGLPCVVDRKNQELDTNHSEVRRLLNDFGLTIGH